jgi:threonine aldolase
MNFCSDNGTGASSEVIGSLVRANEGHTMPYGNDPLTAQANDKIRNLFETDAEIFLVSTGTASNSLALSVMTPPYGAVFCHREAHIEVDECGAPEFFTGGAKLIHMDDNNGLCTAAGFDAAWNHLGKSVHQVQPSAVSLTQTSEAGTLYSVDTIRAISDAAHGRGLHVHMDGTRFANAVVAANCTPAEMSWKAGIDVLSFGASKNGCLAAEAVVFFNRELAKTFEFHRKRGGHLLSKMWFIAAQWDAYIDNDLWLENARHANAMAKRLADGLSDITSITFRFPVEANLMFVELPELIMDGLEADGFQFYRMVDAKGSFIRLVTAFNTEPAHVDSFIASASRQAATE